MNLAYINHYINGQIIEGTSGRQQNVYNPANGEVTGQVALASTDEVNRTVGAAQAAFPAWSAMPPIRRARLMNRFLTLLNANKDELARAITLEHGKEGIMRLEGELV